MTTSNTRVTHRANELVTAGQEGGLALSSFKVTLSGSAPHTIAIKDYLNKDMANADYRVSVEGEFATDACHVDESTITEQGFDLLGGADAEVAHIMIHGQVEGTLEG